MYFFVFQCVSASKKLRIHFLVLLSKKAKKLRLSEAQEKKLVKKLGLRLLPYDSSF
jgi:hypothetical protein